ncbi:hypothetical protein LTR17_026340 [Elasticomyces elasticus]|nr:hypothetical protein LTR17_026340 [Elasticomyces elasticus]
MDLPFSTHPLYNIRRANIIIALVALLFCLFSPQPWWYSDPFQFEACILLVSLIFLAADLCCYAEKKKRDPERDPPWPSRKVMLGDAALAVVLLGAFMAAVSAAANSYGSAGRVVGAYTALGALVCSVSHAYSFWKELGACYKAKWLASIRIAPQPCARCGYSEIPTECPCRVHCTHPHLAGPMPPNSFFYSGSSATPVRRATASASERTVIAMTPDSPSLDSTMEEGLLIGSDLGTGYGSIVEPEREPTLEQPEETIVSSSSSKAKGKKKVVDKKEKRSRDVRAAGRRLTGDMRESAMSCGSEAQTEALLGI